MKPSEGVRFSPVRMLLAAGALAAAPVTASAQTPTRPPNAAEAVRPARPPVQEALDPAAIPLIQARENLVRLHAASTPGSEERRNLESSIRDLDQAIADLGGPPGPRSRPAERAASAPR